MLNIIAAVGLALSPPEASTNSQGPAASTAAIQLAARRDGL